MPDPPTGGGGAAPASRMSSLLGTLGRIFLLDTEEKRIMWILFFANLMNYMDRFTIAGVLTQIKAEYGFDDKEAGGLQTVFIVAYLITAPIFGFLSDRYNRKILILFGMSVWLVSVVGGSFVPVGMAWLFYVTRALVGVGEASYGVIVPTMIADMFAGNLRSTMLMFFYIATPVGSGLGYAVGALVSALTGSWRWGMRVTPAFGLVVLILTAFFVKDPQRGQSDTVLAERTSLWSDVKYLSKRKTFWLTTSACTCNFFVIGALSWWTPTITKYAYAAQNGGSVPPAVEAALGIKFGGVTCVGGLVGVALGTFLSTFSRKLSITEASFYRGADPFICAVACLFAAPMLFIALEVFIVGINVGWIFTFLAVTALCVPWAVNTDIIMRTTVPNRRGLANSIMTCFSHLLGDSVSPYLVGVISDAILKSYGINPSDLDRYSSLKYALIAANGFLGFAAAFYFGASYTIVGDLDSFESDMQYVHHRVEDMANSMPDLQVPTRETAVFSNANASAEPVQQRTTVEIGGGSTDPIVSRNSCDTSRVPSGSTEPSGPAAKPTVGPSDKAVKEVRKEKPKAKGTIHSSEEDLPLSLDSQIKLDSSEENRPLIPKTSQKTVDQTQIETERSDVTQSAVDITQPLLD